MTYFGVALVFQMKNCIKLFWPGTKDNYSLFLSTLPLRFLKQKMKKAINFWLISFWTRQVQKVLENGHRRRQWTLLFQFLQLIQRSLSVIFLFIKVKEQKPQKSISHQ